MLTPLPFAARLRELGAGVEQLATRRTLRAPELRFAAYASARRGTWIDLLLAGESAVGGR